MSAGSNICCLAQFPNPHPPLPLQVQETLPAEVLAKMGAPPKADDPIITADQLPEFDGFLFGACCGPAGNWFGLMRGGWASDRQARLTCGSITAERPPFSAFQVLFPQFLENKRALLLMPHSTRCLCSVVVLVSGHPPAYCAISMR